MKKFLLYMLFLFLLGAFLYPGINNPFRKYILGPSQVHKTIYVENSFNQVEYELIREAAHEWETSTQDRVSFDVHYGFDKSVLKRIHNDNDSFIITKANSDDKLINFLDQLTDNGTLGYFHYKYDVQAIVVLPERMRGLDYYRAVFMHEMGHSIGISHSDDKDSVMYPTMNEVFHLTKNDVTWFCRAYYCDASGLGAF